MVFSDDFDGGQAISGGVGAALSGVTTTESVQGYAGLGGSGNQFSGDFLRNVTGGAPIGTAGSYTTLTLTNLPAHTSIDLDFLLATIDTWDGIDGNPGVSPDYFNVRVDGVEVFEATFAQLSGNPINAYQAQPGGELSVGNDLMGTPISEGAYDMGVDPILSSIAHTGSTLVIDFYADGDGWQAEQSYFNYASDESWAIDNLRVSINAIPEPRSLLLCLGIAAVGLSLTCRGRRTQRLK